jgi:undecaprenyl phosphate-alpha-L-ara4N flippase subunit ArnE
MTGGRGRRAFLNPYLQLALGVLSVTAAEILLKIGAVAGAADDPQGGIFGVSALAAAPTWLGIILYCLSFVSWLYVLRLLPLTEAFALVNVVHILVPLAAWLFLNESISLTRAAGIAMVVAGAVLIATSAAKLEAEL